MDRGAADLRGVQFQSTRIVENPTLDASAALKYSRMADARSHGQMNREIPFDERARASSSWGLLALVVGALFVFKFAILMADSAVFGRLALPPVYDDVSYFVDGLLRLDVFRSLGMTGLVTDLWRHPPHAPYSTLSATIAFMIAGPARGAAYFMNAAAVLLITLFSLRLFRASLGFGVLFGFILITTKWFDDTITYFHPDLVAGYAAAAVAAALVFQDEVMTSFTRTLAVGVAAALVLLIKPVAFPVTLLFLGVAWGAGAVASVLFTGSIRTSARRLAVGLGAILVIAGPYYWHELSNILAYLRLGFVGQADIWRVDLSPIEHALYYFKTTINYLGLWFYVTLAFVLVAAIHAFRQNRLILVVQLCGLLLCAVVGYAIPTATAMKREIFGAFLYGALLVLLFCSALYLHRSVPELAISRCARRIAAITIVLIAFFSFRDGQGHFPPAKIADGQRGYDGIYAIISQQRHMRASGLPPVAAPIRVFMPVPSPVPAAAFEFRSLAVDGLPMTISTAIDARNLATLAAGAENADMVVVQDANLASKVFQYPAVAFLEDFRSELANHGFGKIGSVLLSNGELIAYARPPKNSANRSSE